MRSVSLRGSDAHRRAWYAAHHEMRRVRAFRLRVHHPDVDDEDFTADGSARWSADWATVGSLTARSSPPREWFDEPLRLPDGSFFDKVAWWRAYHESEHREGPPTPTAMPLTVAWVAQLRDGDTCAVLWGTRWGAHRVGKQRARELVGAHVEGEG